MKTIIRFAIAVIFITSSITSGKGQNIVPNPSFEDYTTCPNGSDQVSNHVTGWDSYNGSPEYYNTCAEGTIVGVPNNYGGYHPAASGNAYCGVATFITQSVYPTAGGFREYIGENLSTNLIIGTKYYVSLKVNCMSINYLGPNNCATNNFGVKFSIYPYNPQIFKIPQNNATIKNNTIITDTVNWTRIFGSFIADSAYQYIIIGNFYDDNHTDTLIMNNDSLCRGAYYLIDDVCVSTDSAYAANYSYTGVEEINNEINLQIFPNPTPSSLHIKSSIPIEYLQIINTLGEVVFTKSSINSHEFTLPEGSLPAGMYFVKVKTRDAARMEKVCVVR